MKRRLLGALAVVLAALLVATLYVDRLRTGPGFDEGELVVPGLSAGVDVLRDEYGIPHLWASSLDDALFAQGWLHARDRLWQMELLRRVAEGRLSELFGPSTLATDRFLRTLGMGRAAEANARTLDRATRAALQAYVEGINAAIDGWRGSLPPEFVVLRARPEPWTVAQALSLEKVMAWDLAEYELTLDLTAAARRLEPGALELVHPDFPAWGPTIVGGWPEGGEAAWREGGSGEGGEDREASGVRAVAPVLPAPEVMAAAEPPPEARLFLEMGSAVRASNAWVVGGGRSASGKPLLANDMHLGLDAPNIWYLMGLHAPGLDVVGMSLPGSPGVVAGHTPAVAWGFTNASLDDVDLFVERVDPADSSLYLTPDGGAPFETRREVIRVKGEPADTLVVRTTRHGPVVSDVEARAGGELLALRWVAHDPSGTPRAVLALNRARSVDDVLSALEDFDNPHQNVVFTDTAGAWGYWMAGRVPLRRAGGPPPILPVPGWTGEHDWVGELPFPEHPHALAPEEGFVVTANNRQQRGEVGALVTRGTWARPYRAIRIRELLEARERHDGASMLAAQMDVGSAFVTRYLPAAVQSFRDAGLDSLAAELEGWDGRATLESREATLFHAWIRELRAVGRSRLYGEGEDAGYFPLSAVERMLDRGMFSAEDRAAAVNAAAGVASSPWGDGHLLTLDHPLAAVPVLGWLFHFGRTGIPRAGGPHSPNVADFQGRRPPFRVTHGPSQRHVVDMADPDRGGFVLPGGQSGWPDSRHAFDQLPLWREGGLIPLPVGRQEVEARTVTRLRMLPGG